MHLLTFFALAGHDIGPHAVRTFNWVVGIKNYQNVFCRPSHYLH